MKKFSLKALGTGVLALGIISATVSLPAYAATMTSASAISTSTSGTTGTNATAITISATTVSAAVNYNDLFYVDLPTGWTFASTFSGPSCNANTVTATGINLVFCSASNTGTPRLKLANGTPMPAGIPAGTVVTVTFEPGFLNLGSGRDFVVGTSGFNGATQSDDSATVTLSASGGGGNGGGSTPSPTPDPALVKTGFDAAPYLFGGLALALTGGVLMLIARRKQSN